MDSLGGNLEVLSITKRCNRNRQRGRVSPHFVVHSLCWRGADLLSSKHVPVVTCFEGLLLV